MTRMSAWLFRNLKRIEVSVAVVVIAALAGVFMQRMAALESVAERAAFDLFLQDLRTRVRMLNVLWLEHGGIGRILELAGTNPVVLLAPPADLPSWAMDDDGQAPVNGYSGYLGEVDGVGAGRLKKGAWVFDISSGELMYRAVSRPAFGLQRKDTDLLRYRLALDFDDDNGNSAFDSERERLHGLHLKAVAGPRSSDTR